MWSRGAEKDATQRNGISEEGKRMRMEPQTTGKVIWDAEFNPNVRTYWLLGGALVLAVTVVGIILLPIWFFVGNKLTGHYLKRMRCVLTEKALHFGKGLFTRVEKTVPLEKITDLGLVQGPLMRYFGIEALKVETAGQSSEGALVQLLGIVETRKFRDAVLSQRDRLAAAAPSEARRPDTTATSFPSSATQVLTDIRDTLHRIERRLGGGD
jgi:putative membrane protein